MNTIKLNYFLDKTHGLCKLADRLNWALLSKELGAFFSDSKKGAIPIRTLMGLHYLKFLENDSDENIVEKFCENPYWQYFCGMETFAHQLPCYPSTLVEWRRHCGKKRINQLLTRLIYG